jgi:uncharacterized cupin superfamily protein
MSACTVKALSSVDAYDGPGKIDGIDFRAVGKALGISAWGMNVLEMKHGADGYPAHDHKADGQEEVYFVVKGSAVLVADGVEHPLSAGTFVRVPPDVTCTFRLGPDGATVLAIGGTPGKAFVTMIP